MDSQKIDRLYKFVDSILQKGRELRHLLLKMFDQHPGLVFALITALLFAFPFFAGAFEGLDDYFQAMVFQMGPSREKTRENIVIVKKDSRTSSMLRRPIGRTEYASLMRFLGSPHTRKFPFESSEIRQRCLELKFGTMPAKKGKILSHSLAQFDRVVSKWEMKAGKPGPSSMGGFLGFVFGIGTLAGFGVGGFMFFRKRNRPGVISVAVGVVFLTVWVAGPSFYPSGEQPSVGETPGAVQQPSPDRLAFFSFNENIIDYFHDSVIGKMISPDDDPERALLASISEVLGPDGKSAGQPSPQLQASWDVFFLNLLRCWGVVQVRVFPKDNVPLQLSFDIFVPPPPESFSFPSAKVVSFDIVLEGEKIASDDERLEAALKDVQAPVVLACQQVIEEGGPREVRGADVESSPSGVQSTTQSRKTEGNLVTVLPLERFLTPATWKGFINVGAGQKSHVTRIPMFVEISGKGGEDFHLEPSFSLITACKVLDLENPRPPGATYCDALGRELTRIGNSLGQRRRIEALQRELARVDRLIQDYHESQSMSEDMRIKTSSFEEYKLMKASVEERIASATRAMEGDSGKGEFMGGIQINDIYIPTDNNGFMMIWFFGSTQTLAGSFRPVLPSVSLYNCFGEDLLTDPTIWRSSALKEVDPAKAYQPSAYFSQNIGNKICLVGTYELSDFDFYSTPLTLQTPMCSFKGTTQMGVELHANALLTILERRFLKPAQVAHTLLLLVLGTLILGWFLDRVPPLLGGLITVGAHVLVFWFSYYSYHYRLQGLLFSPTLFSFPMTFLGTTLTNYLRQRARANTTKAMFSRFVAGDVVQYMIEHPDMIRPGGQKIEMTIFFSDVAGFTTISEMLSPEDLVVLMNEYLGAMTELLFKHGGTLDKYIGDAVMAFWNCPREQEDHAVRACMYALEMQVVIKELQKGWAARGLPKAYARAGLNTAKVVVGFMGASERMNYTCLGDGVNLASRLEGANKEYGTLMMASDATFQKAKHRITGRFLDFLAVKGKTEPVKVHELVAIRGEEPPGFFNKLELYDKAIEFHNQRRWDDAIETFETLLANFPEDGPSKTYIKRCHEYKENPPPDKWDLSYHLTHK